MVATASSALFDLSQANAVFEAEGLDRYRRFQRDSEETLLKPGPAFVFILQVVNLAKPTAANPLAVSPVKLLSLCNLTLHRAAKNSLHVA